MHISYILWNRNSKFGMLMHLGMPEFHKPFFGHCDLDLWPSFQELLCLEHISYIIWCRNPKFGVVIPLGMAEWCIPFWVTLTLTLTSDLISRFLCYITANFPQMCLMLDQFLWEHSSRVCDISCLVLKFEYWYWPVCVILMKKMCLFSECFVENVQIYRKLNKLHVE